MKFKHRFIFILTLITTLMMTMCIDSLLAEDQEFDFLIEDALNQVEGRPSSDLGGQGVTIEDYIRKGANDDPFENDSYGQAVISPSSSVITSGLISIEMANDSYISLLEVKNGDIREVLEMLSEKSGLEFILDADVTGQISIFLNEIEVFDALKSILDANNLAFKEENGIVAIMTSKTFESKFGYSYGQEMQTKIVRLLHLKAVDIIEILNEMKSEEGKVIYNDKTDTFVLIDVPDRVEAMRVLIDELDVPLETEVFDLKYVEVSEIFSLIENQLTMGIGRIQMGESSNSLVITDTSLKTKKIADLIKSLDKEDEKLILETKIIRIILSEEHQQGVDWEAIVTNYKGIAGSNNEILSLGTVSEEDFIILLDALDTVGAIDTVSQNEISTGLNVPAKVSFLQQEIDLPIRRNKNENLKNKEHTFFITALKSIEGEYKMRVMPQFSSQDSAENTNFVKMKANSTVVIGGLFKEIIVERQRKIPLLGDIPLLGFAFRNQGREEKKTEVVVFVTLKKVDQ